MTALTTYSEISELWMEYKNAVRFYILKKVKNEEVANDLSHEVLLKIYHTCCSTTKIRNVRSWIFQIAHNTTIDYLKIQGKYSDNVPEIDDSEPERCFSGAEEIVKPILSLLPEKYAVPLYLSDIEGLKQKEVAQKLKLSLTAVKSRIQRARKLFKEKIIACSILEKNDAGKIISLEMDTECRPDNKRSN